MDPRMSMRIRALSPPPYLPPVPLNPLANPEPVDIVSMNNKQTSSARDITHCLKTDGGNSLKNKFSCITYEKHSKQLK